MTIFGTCARVLKRTSRVRWRVQKKVRASAVKVFPHTLGYAPR